MDPEYLIVGAFGAGVGLSLLQWYLENKKEKEMNKQLQEKIQIAVQEVKDSYKAVQNDNSPNLSRILRDYEKIKLENPIRRFNDSYNKQNSFLSQ